MNDVLAPRIADLISLIESDGLPPFQRLTKRLKEAPSDEKPSEAPNQPTYDAMLLSLLLQVWDEVKPTTEERRSEKLVEVLRRHLAELEQRTQAARKEREAELAEQAKLITSEDMKDGFDVSVRSFLSFFPLFPLRPSSTLPGKRPMRTTKRPLERPRHRLPERTPRRPRPSKS